jgi:hypothetical protein
MVLFVAAATAAAATAVAVAAPAAAATLLAVLLLALVAPLTRWRLRSIPGPFTMPIVGSLPEALRRGSFALFAEYRARYGGVFKASGRTRSRAAAPRRAAAARARRDRPSIERLTAARTSSASPPRARRDRSGWARRRSWSSPSRARRTAQCPSC